MQILALGGRCLSIAFFFSFVIFCRRNKRLLNKRRTAYRRTKSINWYGASCPGHVLGISKMLPTPTNRAARSRIPHFRCARVPGTLSDKIKILPVRSRGRHDYGGSSLYEVWQFVPHECTGLCMSLCLMLSDPTTVRDKRWRGYRALMSLHIS